MPFDVLIERLTRHHLDDPAKDIGRDRILESRGGLMRQRQLGQPGDHLGGGELGRADTCLDVCLVHGSIAELTVDETRGVTQKVLDRWLAVRRDQRDLALGRGRICRLDADLEVLQLRQVGGDRLVQEQSSLLDQLHYRDGRDWLGQRGEPEHRARRHRNPVRRRREAERPLVHHVTIARDHHDGPGNLAAVDARLVPPIERGKAIGRESLILGRPARERLCVRNHGPCKQDRRRHNSKAPALYAYHRSHPLEMFVTVRRHAIKSWLLVRWHCGPYVLLTLSSELPSGRSLPESRPDCRWRGNGHAAFDSNRQSSSASGKGHRRESHPRNASEPWSSSQLLSACGPRWQSWKRKTAKIWQHAEGSRI